MLAGLKLQYRSKRRGFQHYVQGQVRSRFRIEEVVSVVVISIIEIVVVLTQIREVGRSLFHQHIEIHLLKQEVVFDTVICQYHLKFDNKAFSRVRAGVTIFMSGEGGVKVYH